MKCGVRDDETEALFGMSRKSSTAIVDHNLYFRIMDERRDCGVEGQEAQVAWVDLDRDDFLD